MVIRRVGVLSLGKVLGMLYGLMGILVGAFFSLFSLLGALGAGVNEELGGAFASLIFGVGSILFFPIFYGILGFLGGLLVAFLYNFIAGMAGGIELEVEDTTANPAAPAQQYSV